MESDAQFLEGGIDNEIVVEIRPRKAFIPFLTSKKRLSVLIVHRRGGKTVACIQRLCERALTYRRAGPPTRYGYIGPTRQQTKDVAWGYLKSYLSQVPNVVFNEAELTAKLVDQNASICLYSGDSYERMRGLYFDGVIIDEYEDQDPNAWKSVIRATLSDYKGWAVFIGTLKGRNGLWRVYEAALKDPRWYTLLLPADKSMIIPQEELDDVLADIGEDAFRQEYLCDPTVATPGAIFLSDIERCRAEGRMNDNIMHVSGFPVYTSWDLGAAVNTKVWVFQLIGDKIKYLRALSGSRSLDTPAKWALWLKEMGDKNGYQYGRHFLPHDASTFWEPAFREADIFNCVVLPKPRSEWDPINSAKRSLDRCHFYAMQCADGLRGLEFWASKEKAKGAYIDNKPNHDWASHWGTAFANGLYGVGLGLAMGGVGRMNAPKRAASKRAITGFGNSLSVGNTRSRLVANTIHKMKQRGFDVSG